MTATKIEQNYWHICINSTCSQPFLHVTNIKYDPVREALWRMCFIPLSVTITDAMLGSEWSFLQEYIWVPDTFPYICSTCRERRVEECGGCSWGEDLRLTTCSASVTSPTLIYFSSTQATGFSSRKRRVTHNSWIFNKHLIYTIDIWIRACVCFNQLGQRRHLGG